MEENKKICCNCRKEFNLNDGGICGSEVFGGDDNEYFCQDCVDEISLIFCYDDELYHHNNDCGYFDNEYYSNDWLDNNTFYCCHCGDRFSNDRSNEANDGDGLWCDNCANYNLYYSEIGDCYYVDYNNSPEAENESDEFVFDYHSNEGRGDESNGERLTVGIEIEKEDYNAKTKDEARYLLDTTGWVKEHDGSLDSESGFEAISPVLNFKNVFESLNKIKYIVNADYSSSCGGHIHVADKKRTPTRILKDCAGYLPMLYAMYPKRIKNSYCIAKDLKDYTNEYKSRHQAFNIGYKTLEFRIFPSPKNMKTLTFRVKLLEYMLKNPINRFPTFINRLYKDEKLLNLFLSVYSKDKLLEKITQAVEFAYTYKHIRAYYRPEQLIKKIQVA